MLYFGETAFSPLFLAPDLLEELGENKSWGDALASSQSVSLADQASASAGTCSCGMCHADFFCGIFICYWDFPVAVLGSKSMVLVYIMLLQNFEHKNFFFNLACEHTGHT